MIALFLRVLVTLMLLTSTVYGSELVDRSRVYTHKSLGSEFCTNIILEGSLLHIVKFKHWLNEIVKVPHGRATLEAVELRPGTPVQPMLASTAPSVAEALAGESSVEWKLDGARVQVHRVGDRVTVWTRNLNDVTARVPEIAAAVSEPLSRAAIKASSLFAKCS